MDMSITLLAQSGHPDPNLALSERMGQVVGVVLMLALALWVAKKIGGKKR